MIRPTSRGGWEVERELEAIRIPPPTYETPGQIALPPYERDRL